MAVVIELEISKKMLRRRGTLAPNNLHSQRMGMS
jgi:hypothetical protein